MHTLAKADTQPPNPNCFKFTNMKRTILLFTILCFALVVPTFAQQSRTPRTPHKPRHVYPAGLNKDNGEGARINFGLAFAPSFDWMYTKTPGHERDGIVAGIRYGIPINVNLTKGKNYYVSTGIFLEHIGGKLALSDSVILPNIGGTVADIHRTYRAMYLTIPVGVTLKTNSINNFYVCGNAGLYNSLLLRSSHVDGCILGDELWSRERQPYDKAFVLKEAFYAGMGFEYAVTPKMRAGIMANYVHSLTNFFKGRDQAYNSVLKVNPKAQIGYFELAIHINFL